MRWNERKVVCEDGEEQMKMALVVTYIHLPLTAENAFEFAKSLTRRRLRTSSTNCMLRSSVFQLPSCEGAAGRGVSSEVTHSKNDSG